MLSGLYHKIKNANADELRRWRFVFWLSFISFSFLFSTILLLIGFLDAGGEGVNTVRGLKEKKNVPMIGVAPLMAVMIDNALEARPQSGLNAAPLVIEAPVEGGYTRFAAFFNSDAPIETIGPVRSVRPYFIDLAKSFGAAIVHIGGSPEAMAEMANYPYDNIDGIKSGCCMWRSAKRFSPHNAYTSSELLKTKVASNAFAPTIQYQDMPGKVPTGEAALGVSIEFNKNVAKTSWHYNSIFSGYVRYQGDNVLKDELDDKPVMTENVVVLKTNIEVIDSEARRAIDTKSGGRALFFLGGKVINGNWQRSDSGVLQFSDDHGAPMVWEPGRIWIEVVDTDFAITIL